MRRAPRHYKSTDVVAGIPKTAHICARILPSVLQARSATTPCADMPRGHALVSGFRGTCSRNCSPQGAGVLRWPCLQRATIRYLASELISAGRCDLCCLGRQHELRSVRPSVHAVSSFVVRCVQCSSEALVHPVLCVTQYRVLGHESNAHPPDNAEACDVHIVRRTPNMATNHVNYFRPLMRMLACRSRSCVKR